MKTTLKYNFMGVAKAKDTERGRNTFLGVLFYIYQKLNRTFAIFFSIDYTMSKEVAMMKEQKYYLVFDGIERGIILRSLNEFRDYIRRTR